MENKQTAVDWLYEHLFPKQIDGFSEDEWNKIDTAFAKAKEMEKEQHGLTWVFALLAMGERGNNFVRAWSDFDDFYNETYVGNK